MPRRAEGPPRCSVELVCISSAKDFLTVLLAADDRHPQLPCAPYRDGTELAVTAKALARARLGRAPAWIDQLGAFESGSPGIGPGFGIAFVAVAPHAGDLPTSVSWSRADRLPPNLTARHRLEISTAILQLRACMDHVPIAFHLMPATFTLSDLQRVYELLLQRRLHKASFRRALLAARLVAATDQWRVEGRGRPAQLYRYAPRRRRGLRPLRFDALGG